MAFSHLTYTSRLFVLMVAFALVAIVVLALRFGEGPKFLKVAVGPADGTDAKLVAMITQHLERAGARTRFTIVPDVDNPAKAAEALEKGTADLAVVRSDVAIPGNGATVVTLHNDIAALIAPKNSPISKVRDLSKKRVGIFPATAENAALLDAVLAEYEIAPETVQHVKLSVDDLADVAAQKRADVIFAVGPLRSPSIEQAATAFASAGRAPIVIPIDEAEGMAARNQAYQKIDIPAGFFRGSPPRPKEAVATLSIAVRLEARQDLSDQIVTDLTKRLFVMRRSVESEAEIGAIEKPDTDKDSVEAVHPGAATYYDNDEKSFMDQYGDWIYIAAMAFSCLSSAVAGVTRTRVRKAALALIDQLIEAKQVAHATTKVHRLAGLEAKIENLSTKGLHFARDNNFDEAGLMALRLAIDEARRAVTQQRDALVAKLTCSSSNIDAAEG
jgi:TRAP transporter TAXI family solute receptor